MRSVSQPSRILPLVAALIVPFTACISSNSGNPQGGVGGGSNPGVGGIPGTGVGGSNNPPGVGGDIGLGGMGVGGMGYGGGPQPGTGGRGVGGGAQPGTG